LKARFRNVSLILVIVSALFIPVSTFSAENCLGIVKQLLESFDQQIAKGIDLDQHINHRVFIGNYAKKNDIPVFYKQNLAGEDIPFILVNRNSSKKLSNFIENSYGTEVALQPGYNNDHGLLRAGNNIIDVDAPGYRGYGEIHKTGLAWKDFASYTSRRKTDSGVILEVSYLLTPEEKKTIDFYQRIRRAAIFRVKFAFKDFKTEDHPFLLNTGGEHCFIFCKAQAVSTHNYELQSKLNGMGLKNIDEFLKKPEVIANINKIKEIVLNTPPMDLAPEILLDPSIIKSFDTLYPAEIQTNIQKFEFLRWVISYEGSNRYNRVLKDLGVTSDFGIDDARNKRVSAVLVYDEAAKPEDFNHAQYTTKGAFTSWPTGTQKPVE
jgi:hypothetical protein